LDTFLSIEGDNGRKDGREERKSSVGVI